MSDVYVNDFKDQVIVITGSAVVLGTDFAKALAKGNGKIEILDLDVNRAKEVAKEITDLGYEAIGLECNVLKKESIENAHKATIAKYGKIDILVNGAGGNHPKGTTD